MPLGQTSGSWLSHICCNTRLLKRSTTHTHTHTQVIPLFSMLFLVKAKMMFVNHISTTAKLQV